MSWAASLSSFTQPRAVRRFVGDWMRPEGGRLMPYSLLQTAFRPLQKQKYALHEVQPRAGTQEKVDVIPVTYYNLASPAV